MEFPAKLKKLMWQSHLSQAKVAERVGVHQTLVSGWCRGLYIPDLRKAKALADMFGVSVEFLADDSLDEPSAPVPLSAAERAILDDVRYLGVEEAKRRLMQVPNRPDETKAPFLGVATIERPSPSGGSLAQTGPGDECATPDRKTRGSAAKGGRSSKRIPRR